MKFWCREQLVVTVEGPAGRSVITLEQPFARVGRHPQSDVVLDDPSATMRSLYLHATPRGVYCLFLDVHEADVPASDVAARGIWLRPNQEISLGNHRVSASLLTAEPDDPLPEENPGAWGSAPRPLPVIGVYYGDLLKDKRRFRAVLSPVGRRPQCGLQLKAKRVSSFHCVLFWHEQQLWCVDLNSSNGTQLNGEPIVCSDVTLGDKLDVGEFSLVFERLSYGRAATAGKPAPEAPSSIASNPEDPSPAEILRTTPASSSPVVAPADEMGETLRRQLADEIARLAEQRASIEQRWEQTTRQLQSDIARLHDEADRLTAERSEFDESRSRWNQEREALDRQLAERSEQLARLQAELTQATEALQQKLAAAKPSYHVDPEEASSAPPDAEMLAALAPATLIAGLDDELAPPLEPEVVWNFTPFDPNDNLPPPVDPAEEVRSRLEAEWKPKWEETNRELNAQIEQLRAQSAELTAERQALGQSRQSWQAEQQALHAEQQALAESLAARQTQIDRQQAEVSAAAAALAARLADSEAQMPSPPGMPSHPPPPEISPVPLLPPDVEPEVEWDPEPEVRLESLAELRSLPENTSGAEPGPVAGPVLPAASESAVEPAPKRAPERSDDELESMASEVFELPAPLPEHPEPEGQPTDSVKDVEAEGENDLDVWEEAVTEQGSDEANELAIVAHAEQPLSASERAHRDELALFVTNRLVSREREKNRPQLVWWVVAGAGAIVVVATIAAVVWWMF